MWYLYLKNDVGKLARDKSYRDGVRSQACWRETLKLNLFLLTKIRLRGDLIIGCKYLTR